MVQDWIQVVCDIAVSCVLGSVGCVYDWVYFVDVRKMGDKMSERPIVLAGDEVLQILSGRKTQIQISTIPQPVLDGNFWKFGGAGWSTGIKSIRPIPNHSLYYACPLGEPGDKLWIQEAWAQPIGMDEKTWSPPDITEFPGAIIRYIADGTFNNFHGQFYTKWFTNPASSMPRWASRILLEITDVEIEQSNNNVWWMWKIYFKIVKENITWEKK